MQEIQETRVGSLGWEDALQREMATHSSILSWKIPRTEEPGGLQSWGQKQLEITEHAHTPTDVVLTHVSGPILIMESHG